MEMRALKTSDIFKLSKILKKMNLKFDVNKDTTQSEMGLQFIQSILENAHMAEDEVNAFLGELVGITADEFSELEIEETLKVMALFKKQKGIANFLKLAGQ